VSGVRDPDVSAGGDCRHHRHLHVRPSRQNVSFLFFLINFFLLTGGFFLFRLEIWNSCSKWTTVLMNTVVGPSVADPRDPDFYPFQIPDVGSRIPDPTIATKEKWEIKFVVLPFFLSLIFFSFLNW
jgi:hypothetical protein